MQTQATVNKVVDVCRAHIAKHFEPSWINDNHKGWSKYSCYSQRAVTVSPTYYVKLVKEYITKLNQSK